MDHKETALKILRAGSYFSFTVTYDEQYRLDVYQYRVDVMVDSETLKPLNNFPAYFDRDLEKARMRGVPVDGVLVFSSYSLERLLRMGFAVDYFDLNENEYIDYNRAALIKDLIARSASYVSRINVSLYIHPSISAMRPEKYESDYEGVIEYHGAELREKFNVNS